MSEEDQVLSVLNEACSSEERWSAFSNDDTTVNYGVRRKLEVLVTKSGERVNVILSNQICSKIQNSTRLETRKALFWIAAYAFELSESFRDCFSKRLFETVLPFCCESDPLSTPLPGSMLERKRFRFAAREKILFWGHKYGSEITDLQDAEKAVHDLKKRGVICDEEMNFERWKMETKSKLKRELQTLREEVNRFSDRVSEVLNGTEGEFNQLVGNIPEIEEHKNSFAVSDDSIQVDDGCDVLVTRLKELCKTETKESVNSSCDAPPEKIMRTECFSLFDVLRNEKAIELLQQKTDDDDMNFIPGVTSLNYYVTVDVDRSEGFSKAVSEGKVFIPSIVDSLKGRAIQLRRLVEKLSKQDDYYSAFNTKLRMYGVGEDDFYDRDYKSDKEMVDQYEDLLEQLKETRRKAEKCKQQLEMLKLDSQ